MDNSREDEIYYRQIVEQMPFPVEVFSLDGTAVMVNKALLEKSGIPSADLIVGTYNIFQDPAVENSGWKEQLLRAFKGETVSFTDIRVPLKQLEDIYGVKDREIISIYQDIVAFPLLNQKGEVVRVAVFFKDQREYKVTNNIRQSIKFLQENYHNEYCLEDVARAASLSPYHFIRVFKAQTGKTPYDFFMDLKIQRAKELLHDQTKTITEICADLDFPAPVTLPGRPSAKLLV